MTTPVTKTILKKASREVRATSFLNYRDYLKAIYVQIKQKTGDYSYLQFSSDLGLSRTNVVHLIIQGKRPLTAKAGKAVADALQLSQTDRLYFEALISYQNSRIPDERARFFETMLNLKSRVVQSELDKAQLEYFSEWYHPAIREMTFMPSFKSDPSWIADRTNPRIRPEQARHSLELLEKLGLVRFDRDLGRHVPTESNVTTGDEVSSVALVQYHRKVIDLGRESMTAVAESSRDISSITICVSEATAEILKQEIQRFRKKLLQIAEDELKKQQKPDPENDSMEVYQANFQLFPLTK